MQRYVLLFIKNLLFSAVVGMVCASPVTADVLKLSPEGVAAVGGLARPLNDGSGHFIRGRIVVPRDAAGKLTLRDPYMYFMFEPLVGTNKYGPAKKLEWTWIKARKIEIDTLEELRGIISNRDQRYGGWQAGLNALLREIDTDDSIYHLRSKGGAAPGGGGGEAWEGWLTRDLLAGGNDLEAVEAYRKKMMSMPRGDPRGMRPSDSFFQTGTGSSTIGHLIDAIARAEKYGEPEPGFLDAARALAKFICEDLYPADDSLSGPSRDKAVFIQGFVIDARRALISMLPLFPEMLQRRLGQPSRFGNKPEDYFRVDGSYLPFDDVLAISQFDVAKAALSVAGELRTPHDGDGGGEALIEAMLWSASGRADFRAQDPTVKLPAELTPKIDQVGKLAFEKLLGLAKPYSHHRRSLFAAFGSAQQKHPEQNVGAPSLMAAGGEAVVAAGVASATDVVKFVDGLWATGTVYAGVYPPWAAHAQSVLKRIPQNSDPAAGRLFQTYLATRIKQQNERIRLGVASSEEISWSKYW